MPNFQELKDKVNSSGGLLNIIREQLNNMAVNGDVQLRSLDRNFNKIENDEENQEEEESLQDNSSSQAGSKNSKDNRTSISKYNQDQPIKMETSEAYGEEIDMERLLQLKLNGENILLGIVYSEILGRPKARRRRRR